MSVHTSTHHTNSHSHHAAVIYLSNGHDIYAIPKKIAEKYVIDKVGVKDSIPAEVVFAKLEKKLTRAGALLKGLRVREGLSQIVFAKKINVTQANLSNMENGHRPIGKIVAKRIEKIFAVDYRYFLE